MHHCAHIDDEDEIEADLRMILTFLQHGLNNSYNSTGLSEGKEFMQNKATVSQQQVENWLPWSAASKLTMLMAGP